MGGQLVVLRWQAAKSDDERWQLVYDLWDAANELEGLDSSTASAYKKLCDYMARPYDLIESQPGVWMTERHLHTQKSVKP